MEVEVARPVANFHPDIWADHFLNYTPLDEVTKSQKQQEVKELKNLVQEELLAVVKDPKDRLILIDVIQRLGVAYYFEEEMEANLENFYNNHYEDDCYKDDLHYVSLRFRLLRQRGFCASCDVFERFKYENGSFKDALENEVEGILSLYEASHLRVHGENKLDETLEYTTTLLKSLANKQPSSLMAQKITHALLRPLHRTSTRPESLYQISFYESEPSHNKTLVRFAKLDFNLLQELHKNEVRDLTRWSRSLDVALKLPFDIRDRVVEAYYWSLCVYYEPSYSFARMMVNKVFKIISITDDIYDAYGTEKELTLFTTAIQRWDKSCINELPDYMKLVYQAMLDTFQEFEQELASREGRSHVVYYLKQRLKTASEAYMQEAKWRDENHFPTYDEYLKNGILSSVYLCMIAASFLGMGEIATKHVFEWVHHDSKAPKAVCVIARLVNDMASHKFEQSRGHIASAVECYMNQFGVTQTVAYKELQLQIEEAWKDINGEMLGPTQVPKPLFARFLEITRALHELYQNNEDGYTMNKSIKPKIEAILINPFIMI